MEGGRAMKESKKQFITYIKTHPTASKEEIIHNLSDKMSASVVGRYYNAYMKEKEDAERSRNPKIVQTLKVINELLVRDKEVDIQKIFVYMEMDKQIRFSEPEVIELKQELSKIPEYDLSNGSIKLKEPPEPPVIASKIMLKIHNELREIKIQMMKFRKDLENLIGRNTADRKDILQNIHSFQFELTNLITNQVSEQISSLITLFYSQQNPGIQVKKRGAPP